MFKITLKVDVIKWYVNLPHDNINDSFEKLHHKFLEIFNHLIRRKTDQGALLINVKQKKNEILKNYVKRFDLRNLKPS